MLLKEVNPDQKKTLMINLLGFRTFLGHCILPYPLLTIINVTTIIVTV